MKKILILLFLAASLTVRAATYYVSLTTATPTGNDANAGTLAAPWATWQKGFTTLGTGDTLYIRGGIYAPASTVVGGYYCGVGIDGTAGHDGTSGDPIVVMNYLNEVPIMDGVNITEDGRRYGIYLAYCDYWKISGLTIKNVTQHNSGDEHAVGIYIVFGNNIILNRCVVHHCGNGITFDTDAVDNLILNCDSYSNYDPYSGDAYGGADGFAVGNAGSSNNILRGCRAWYNSDDGFDLWNNNGYVLIDGCQSWMNGYREDHTTQGGDGNGFKLGQTTVDHSVDHLRTVQNCLVFDNRERGIDQSQAQCLIYLYNNTIYRNKTIGVLFYTYDLDYLIKNNVVFGNITTDYDLYGTPVVVNNNYNATWQQLGPVASAADFVSVDSTGVTGARQADGSLSLLTFLHLILGSDLTGTGTNVGVTTDGDGNPRNYPPDIGAFEIFMPLRFVNKRMMLNAINLLDQRISNLEL